MNRIARRAIIAWAASCTLCAIAGLRLSSLLTISLNLSRLVGLRGSTEPSGSAAGGRGIVAALEHANVAITRPGEVPVESPAVSEARDNFQQLLPEIDEQSARTAELEDRIRRLQRQSAADQSLVAQLQQQLADAGRINHLQQKQFARSLQQEKQLNHALAVAVTELNMRLRMLLTSRLLHLGWKVGLGKTPYWNDPAADELADLIEQTRLAVDGSPRKILPQSNSDQMVEPANGMETALSHLYQKGFRPRVVLDIGAARGYWTQNAAYRWPDAEFFMIDPLPQSEPYLQHICQDARFHYLRVAVGDRSGEIAMHVAEDPDSSSLLLTDGTDPASHQTVMVRTVDELLDAGQIKPAQLIKLDVQGFELNALRGAQKLFEHAEVFIVEANLFEFMPGCPRLHELMAFMADHGFYPFDFAGFLRRPYENDLGQVDVVFVNQRSAMVASNRWLSDVSPGTNDHPVPPLLGEGLVISVIICTKDPRPAIFNRTLDALDCQTLGKDRFEVIVVDNSSRLPLELNQLTEGRSLKITLLSEPIPGLSRARCAGISRAAGELFVFVDDDNFLSSDYLEKSLEIARKESRIGLFGGIAEAELESPIPDWKRRVLPHLGIRNHGDQPITKFADRWGEWEPIGAGMVARRPVAERFVRMFNENPEARILGRSGSTLLSGEDTLFARAAFREGYACSYQPRLRLTHFIKASRLTSNYMRRVLEGHGRSYVLLQRALGKPVAALRVRTALARMLYRIKDVGRAGLITGYWELGYAKECQSPSTEQMHTERPAIRLPPATIPMSIVLCTRNPRGDLLQRTLDSLQQQTVDHDAFEVIVVDNASAQPLDPVELRQGRTMRISVVAEPRIGHVFARSAGIFASRGELILFVDDDNFLQPDYVTKTMQIAQEEPTIGAFGGIASPEFELAPQDWKLPLLKYLAVRDHGPRPITSRTDSWGEWEPIGAGLVVRRNIAERFVQLIRDLPGADSLGRSERHLMSGDDALFSRAAYRMGFSTSYQPALRLTHYIKADRLRLHYLARLINGHGRTHALLNLIMETPAPSAGFWRTIQLAGYRLKQDGPPGILLWSWDLGRYLEARKHRADPGANRW